MIYGLVLKYLYGERLDIQGGYETILSHSSKVSLTSLRAELHGANPIERLKTKVKR